MSRANGLWPVRAVNGGLPATEFVQLSASQTCLKGFALFRNATNSEQADVATATSANLLGVAAESRTSGATPGDDDVIGYWPADNNTIFGILADAAIALADIGEKRDLVVDSSGSTDRHLIDIGTTSTNVFQVVNIPRLGKTTPNAEREVHVKIIEPSYPNAAAS